MRTILVGALALAGAVQVVRSAVVQQTVASRPDAAARAWPSHPRVELALAMAEIGAAANRERCRRNSSREVRLLAAALRSL